MQEFAAQLQGFVSEFSASKNQEVKDIKHKAVLASGVVLQQIE